MQVGYTLQITAVFSRETVKILPNPQDSRVQRIEGRSLRYNPVPEGPPNGINPLSKLKKRRKQSARQRTHPYNEIFICNLT